MKYINEKLLKFWIDQINKYARDVENAIIDPLPELIIDNSKNEKTDILISTGGYVPATKQIILNVDNRHIKDLLRSYCHELVHHMQNLDNPDYIRRLFANASEDLVDNPQLEEIEGEAYLKGNLLFRRFTEWFKRQQKQKEKKK